jgi:ADP-ribose pyrophosphatase YjhB (NUDIX family)
VESVTKETKKYFNKTIVVDVNSNDDLLAGILEREKLKPEDDRQTEQALKERFEVLDLPITKLLRLNSMNLHDYLIDNTDRSAPELYDLEGSVLKSNETHVEFEEGKIVSPALNIIENQVRNIEEGRGVLNKGEIDEKVGKIITALKSKRVVTKGEDLDVLKDSSNNEVVVGQIDREVAENFEYIHQTANAIVMTPDLESVVLIRRPHNQKQYPYYLTIPGGHLFSGQTYKEGIVDELEEELELTSLTGELVEVDTYAYGMDSDTEIDKTKERRKLYVYRLTEEEHNKILKRNEELEEIAKGEGGENKLKAELEARQFEGIGEVWSYHKLSLTQIEEAVEGKDDGSPYGKTRFAETMDIVTRQQTRIPFTPDLLNHLVGYSKLWDKVKDTIKRMKDGGENGGGQTSQGGDNAMLSSSSPLSENPGGIDLNEIKVEHQGSGVDIQFDPAKMQNMINQGVDGFAPVIINLTPINSIMPLLGLEPRIREDEYEVSSLN